MPLPPTAYPDASPSSLRLVEHGLDMIIADSHMDLEPLISYSQINIFHLLETSIS